jgi:hypothetical protein
LGKYYYNWKFATLFQMKMIGRPEKGGLIFVDPLVNLLGAGVFGDGLGTFRDGVLGQLTGQQKTNSGLDFPRCDRRALVVVGQTAGFSGNTLENIIDK